MTTKRETTRTSAGTLETRSRATKRATRATADDTAEDLPGRRARATRRTPRREEHYHTPHVESESLHFTALSALELYRLEKERRARVPREVPPDDPMVAAKREYEALLAAEAARGKGGRPKKNAARPKPSDDELENDE